MKSISEQQKFSHEEGLKTIYAMIESTKGKIGENYLYYLLWGYLVAATCIFELILIRYVHYSRHYLVWPIFMGLGLVITGLFNWRQKRRSSHSTFIGSVMAYFWGGWLMSYFILTVFINLNEAYNSILPLTLVMYGLGLFVSGGVICFRPLVAGGLIAWASAVLAFFQSSLQAQLLIMIITVAVTYILPGHLLRISSKRQKS